MFKDRSFARIVAGVALFGFLPQVAACVSVDPPSTSVGNICKFDPVGPDVYIRCSSGPWLVGPVKGGLASGQDGHGHEIFANITLLNGRYDISEIEPAR